MLEIIAEIAIKIVEYTVVLIWRQLCYVLYYRNSLNNLRDHVKDLEVQRDRIQNWVDAERRNGKTIFSNVPEWQQEVEKITREAEQLQRNANRASIGCCSNLLLRHQLGRKAESEAKDVGVLKQKGDFRGVAYDPPSEPDYKALIGGVEMFESRESIMNEIIQAVTVSDDIRMVGVYGLGGVGKTTLMNQVAEKANESFDAVVTASVNQTPDIRSIQGEIADKLDLKLEKESVPGRATSLRKRIKQEKTVLIILDDIWKMLDIKEVGIPFGDHKGCKVVLTSRTQEVLSEMGSQRDFRLEPLDESETWRLFQVKAGDAVKDSRLQGIATQVANKCAGLPVLILAVSRALRGKGIHAWKDASNRLTVNNEDLEGIYHSALELSYNGLEGKDVKELFLLCGVLSQPVSSRDLLIYGMGLGIFKNVTTVEDARNRLHTMIDRLKASCLLLEADRSSELVRMHDNVREVAIAIASRDEGVFTIQIGSELIEWPTTRYTQIILIQCRIRELPKRIENHELRLIYLNNSWNDHSLEIPDFMFEGLPNLEVLDLSCMNISCLPISMSSLKMLKTLCLDRCALGGMAALRDLMNLEILSLFKSSITILPTEIGQLTRLRMLDLTSSGIQLIPPNIISRLITLEEFGAGDTTIKWEAENATKQNKNASIVELSHLPHLTCLDIQIQDFSVLPCDDSFFMNLERYKIFVGDVWTWSDLYDVSNILKLKFNHSTHIGHGVRKLLEGVENLHLDEIKGMSNGIYELNFKGFSQLKSLRIQNNDEICYIVNSLYCLDIFPILDLYNLSKLEKICHGPLIDSSFQKLKVIKVNGCDHLKSLIPFSMIKGLSQLHEIEVSKCHFMKEIVVAENNEVTTIIKFHQLRSLTLQCLPTFIEFFSNEVNSLESRPLLSYKVAFYNLETLKLSSLNLKKIWDDSQILTTCCVQNLTSLFVEGCGNIKYLFSSSMIQSFSKLKLMEISNCQEMEEIVTAKERRNSGDNLSEVQFPKLEKIIINEMRNLKTVWHQEFGSLKTMEVKSCDKLVRIFPSHMQRKFSSLQTIEVTDCSSMEEIFELTANENDEMESEVNTQLRFVTLKNLPNLKQIWSGEAQGILRFNNLEAVRVEVCPKLEYLFPLSIALSLPQLDEISLKRALCMKEFVAKIEGQMERTVNFEFNRLTTLTLWFLPEADRFYAGNFSLRCPLLKTVDLLYCPKLELFQTQSKWYPERYDDDDNDGNLTVSIPQPLFIAEEVIPKLETLNLTVDDVRMIQQGQFPAELNNKLTNLKLEYFFDENATFPHWILQKIPNLISLSIFCCSFREILYEGVEGPIEISTRLKKLYLTRVDKIQHLCKEGSQLDPVLEILEDLFIYECSGLIYLVPFHVTFSHLAYLRVWKCKGLLYLISSSTARSLVNLWQLEIEECESLEEIVKEKGDEMEQHIALIKLRFLKLVCLPKLNWFSSSKCLHWFPFLEELVVEQCPRMKTFSVGDTSTPYLENVQVKDGCLWEGNLNATIKRMSTYNADEEV